MPAPYTGQCLCGAVRFNVTSEPVTVLSCFCDHCRKGAGGPNQVIAKFAAGGVDISGMETISFFTLNDTSSGFPKEKAFCQTCGTPLWTVPGPAQGKFIIVRTAVLDTGFQFKPENELFVKNRPTWMSPSEGAKQWQGMRV